MQGQFTEEKKREKVALAEAHVLADRLVAGDYIDGDKGCSVGCDCIDIAKTKGEPAPEGGYHAYVADYFGTPEWLEHLRDAIFEGLPKQDRAAWHVDLAKALPVGADFKPIYHRIQRDILLEIAANAIGEGDEDWRIACRAAVHSVAALHGRAVTKEVTREEWAAAWAAAGAARDAAGAAAGAAGAAAYKKIAAITLKHLREAAS